MFHGKYCGKLKIMFNEDHRITQYVSSVCLFGWPIAPSEQESGIEK